MTNEEQLLQTLNQWIERIRDEIIRFFFLNHIFWEVQNIIRSNPKLKERKNYFYAWMGDAFVYSAAMFVRRLVDTRRDSLSLLKLLRKLSNHPMTINRDNFLNRTTFRNSALADIFIGQKGEAERIFDELVGLGKDHLEKASIQHDIEQLIKISHRFEEFAKHYVAHHSLYEMPSEEPNFSDLDSCLGFMVNLLEKYYLLITGNRMPSLKDESFDPSWKEVFMFAWIKPNQREG
jgi:hypothetical protein